jgi:AAA15 family ATPase/GTPase
LITSLSINNFRGIKTGKIEGFADINIIIGANGAGKSTILEAIYAASAWAESIDNIRRQNKFDVIAYRRTERGGWNESRSFLWYSMNTGQNIEFTLSFSSGKTMNFIIPYTIRGMLASADMNKMIFLGKNQHYVSPEGYVIDERNNVIMRGSPVEILDFFKEEIEFLRDCTLIDKMLYTRMNFIEESVWPRVFAKRLDKIVINLIREAYEPDAELISYISTGLGKHSLTVGLSQTAVRVDDLGDGARTSMALALILSTMNHTVALIEDPEIHQHPTGLEKILSFIIDVAQLNKIQIFITTQSIDILRFLIMINPANCKIFTLRRRNGAIQSRQFTLDEVESLLESRIDIRRIIEELQI